MYKQGRVQDFCFKKVTYKGTITQPSSDVSAENLQVRGEWNDMLKVLKDKTCQPGILYPARYPSDMKEK